jgi:hypothetical protein
MGDVAAVDEAPARAGPKAMFDDVFVVSRRPLHHDAVGRLDGVKAYNAESGGPSRLDDHSISDNGVPCPAGRDCFERTACVGLRAAVTAGARRRSPPRPRQPVHRLSRVANVCSDYHRCEARVGATRSQSAGLFECTELRPCPSVSESRCMRRSAPCEDGGVRHLAFTSAFAAERASAAWARSALKSDLRDDLATHGELGQGALRDERGPDEMGYVRTHPASAPLRYILVEERARPIQLVDRRGLTSVPTCPRCQTLDLYQDSSTVRY